MPINAPMDLLDDACARVSERNRPFAAWSSVVRIAHEHADHVVDDQVGKFVRIDHTESGKILDSAANAVAAGGHAAACSFGALYDDDHQKLFNDFRRRATLVFRSSVRAWRSAHSRAAALARVRFVRSERPMSGHSIR